MKVLFCPDYRAGNPYQTMLASALAREGVRVETSRDYRRGLPFWRLVRQLQPDLVHLHWPEAYFPVLRDGRDFLRPWRWPIDLWLARRGIPVVLTAHNLWPHHRARSLGVRVATRASARLATRIIVHSKEAGRRLREVHLALPGRIRVIPHGNLAEGMPLPANRDDAARQLGIESTPYCLAFGAIEPYKGFEDLIEAWKRLRPAVPLWIVGRSSDPAYQARLEACAGSDSPVRIVAERPDDARLAAYIVAARAVVFNYRESFTSGGACLARSLGVPVLLPARLTTLDLGEPHSSILRFSDLGPSLDDTLRQVLSRPDRACEQDPDWWQRTAWSTVAAATARVYQEALQTL